MTPRRLLIGLNCLLVIAIIGVAVKTTITILSQPSSGTITTPQQSVATAQTASASINMTPAVQTCPYATYEYPSGMTTQASNPNVGPTLANFNYVYKDIESWNLAVAVNSDPTGQVASDSGYQYRKENPNIYQASQITVDGQTVPIMTDITAGGFSKVAYLIHGSYLATVSLLGDDSSGSAPLQATLSMILNSWKWSQTTTS